MDDGLEEVELDDKGRTLIFGDFNGRPTIDQMGELFASILTGKTKPLGGYSASGKDITIMTPKK